MYRSAVVLCGALAGMGFAVAASAADLPRQAPPPVFTPVPVFSWTGFYIGANASGVVDGDFTARDISPLPGARASISASGFIAGGTVGYNYQFTPGSGFVVGVEGDVGYAGIENRLRVNVPGLAAANVAVSTNSYYATARGRIGYAFGPLLVFATGGYAATEFGPQASFSALGFSGTFDRKVSIDGWTVGGGLEYGITQNVSVKAEYAYSELRKPFAFSVLGTPVRLRAGLDTQQLKVGINYRFNAF